MGGVTEICFPDAGAGGLLPPVVDRYGWVWTVADGALTSVGSMGQRAELSAHWLEGREVTAMDLSAESARLVLRHRSGDGGGDERVGAGYAPPARRTSQ